MSGLNRLAIGIWCLLAVVVAAMPAPAQEPPKQVAREIAQIVRNGEVVFGLDVDDERLFQVYAIYHHRDFTPIWVRDDGPKTKGRALLDALMSADLEGLVPSDYQVGRISELMERTDVRSLAELELQLTRAFLDYGRDLSAGRISPAEVDRDTHLTPVPVDAAILLDGAERADDILPYLASLAPQTPEYDRLRDKLAELRERAEDGGWPTVPAGATLKPGMDDARVPALRAYLAAVGDYKGDPEDTSTVFDAELVEAVKAFQARHGIDVDGAVGPATLAAINTPIEERIETLALNLERRRWMPDDLGERYVFVNLADQFLKVVDGGRTIHDARLVVGKPYSRTPVFSDSIKYVVINPDWTVPASIARSEYLPRLRAAPGSLAAQGFEILAGGQPIDPRSVDWSKVTASDFPYTLRQQPGPNNALGAIKFMFPNPFNVYLHDTPATSLFERSQRTFSHGCMRVENPLDLGAIVLGPQGWTRERIDQVVKSGKKTVVTLEHPLPIHITYLTAWVNKDGSVHFRNDVYGRDQRLREALDRSRLAPGF
jgi:murein L,D-transpeptidase YcbB/YkuD